MARKKKNKLDALLPPTSCTPEMRAQVVAIADEWDRSIADVVRHAVTLFLSSDDRFSVKSDTIKVKETA